MWCLPGCWGAIPARPPDGTAGVLRGGGETGATAGERCLWLPCPPACSRRERPVSPRAVPVAPAGGVGRGRAVTAAAGVCGGAAAYFLFSNAPSAPLPAAGERGWRKGRGGLPRA